MNSSPSTMSHTYDPHLCPILMTHTYRELQLGLRRAGYGVPDFNNISWGWVYCLAGANNGRTKFFFFRWGNHAEQARYLERERPLFMIHLFFQLSRHTYCGHLCPVVGRIVFFENFNVRPLLAPARLRTEEGE